VKINMQQEIKALKKWLENNQPSKMSYLLGYKTSATITHWLMRGSIPEHQIERVKKIINEGKLDEQQFTSGARNNLRSDEGTVRVTG